MRFFECYRIEVGYDVGPAINIDELYLPTVMTVELEDSEGMTADELQSQLGKALHEGFKNIVDCISINNITFEYMEVKHHICGPRCQDENHKNRV